MKSARHQAILDLIEKHPIDRQEDLLAHLREAGFACDTGNGFPRYPRFTTGKSGRCRWTLSVYAGSGFRKGDPFSQPV